MGSEAGKADALLAHARDLLAENDGAEVVPALTAAVEALAAAH